jgi:hypothetical protein
MLNNYNNIVLDLILIWKKILLIDCIYIRKMGIFGMENVRLIGYIKLWIKIDVGKSKNNLNHISK